MKVKCAYCGMSTDKSIGHYNRAMKLGAKLYCNHKCFGLDRRGNETEEEKREIKSWYDMFIRESMTDDERDIYILNKALYFFLDYRENPEKYKLRRQEKMPRHIEYCRQPSYKEKKHKYDVERNAKNTYGEYWEAAVILNELEKMVDNRLAKAQNGLINKSKKRKRLWQKMQAKQTLSSLLVI